MPSFSSIFGKKKEVGPSPQETLQQLNETKDLLRKKQEHLEKKMEAELSIAKKHGTSNKRLALQALKRKKQYQNQLIHLDGVLNTLDGQEETLANAEMNAEILKILGNTASALKNSHRMDIDKVHDLMEDISEQRELADEIAQAISNPVGMQMDDEEDLLAELEELEEKELNEKLISVPAPSKIDTSKLPEVPTNELPKIKSKTKEDEEMAQLQSWAES